MKPSESLIAAEHTESRAKRPAVAAGSGRTTINMVARAAGVSIATVSKVINGRVGVGAGTRERIEKAIDELGYVSLGERQSSVVASREMSIELVVEPEDVSNPYLSTFLGGALEAAAELDTAIVVRSVGSRPREHATVWANDLARAGRAGVIELTSAYSDVRERALKRAGLPMVLVDPIDVPRTTTPSVGATNWEGAYAATDHLIKLGHTKIRYIGGPPRARCDAVRAHGWAAALSEVGVTADLAAVPRSAYTFEHGLRAALEILSSPDRPTAIFAGSDTIAMGVLEATRQLNLQVPQDLSVVGFDDTHLAHMSSPRLTSVHQPIANIGRTAVLTVVRLARGEPITTNRVELSTHLVVRDSTASPAF